MGLAGYCAKTAEEKTANEKSRTRITRAILEQRHLSAARGRCETAAIELRGLAAGAVAIQAEAPAGDVEALLDELGEVAGAGHARAEARIVVLAAAQLVDHADHVLGA